MTDTKVQKVLEEVDNYEQSINACLTFIHIYKWDEKNNRPDVNILHWIGKEYLPGNVTPDITLQLSKERGIVVELKESLPQNNYKEEDYWKEKFEQIKNYDIQFEGWETENKKVIQQELVLIVDQKLVRRVVEYIKNNNLSFDKFSKNFCIIQYSPLTGLKNGTLLRIEEGKIEDFKTTTNKRLWEGIPVEFNYLFETGLSKIKFLDYKPPCVYMMSILWDFVFGSMLTEEDWRIAKMENSRKIIEIHVIASKLRDILIKNFADEHSKQGIKDKWIEEALENFVRLKLAVRKKGSDEYIIKYRKRITDEQSNQNKHQAFAELLYKTGVQFSLDDKTFI
jgi:hypothetical protein